MVRHNPDGNDNDDEPQDDYPGEVPEEFTDDIDELADLYGYDDIEDFLDDYPEVYDLWEDDYLDYLDYVMEYDDEDFY